MKKTRKRNLAKAQEYINRRDFPVVYFTLRVTKKKFPRKSKYIITRTKDDLINQEREMRKLSKLFRNDETVHKDVDYLWHAMAKGLNIPTEYLPKGETTE